MKIKELLILLLLPFFLLTFTKPVEAHRSGCHRWHSCPSDTGSYVCGDLGYPCKYPTYPKSGGVILPNAPTSKEQVKETAKQKKITELKKQIAELMLKLQKLQDQLKLLEQ